VSLVSMARIGEARGKSDRGGGLVGKPAEGAVGFPANGKADGLVKKSVRQGDNWLGSTRRWRTPSVREDYETSLKIYQIGLRHARKRRYSAARRFFTRCAERYPTFERAWVTLAQMEKSMIGHEDKESRKRAVQVLKNGLRCNPRSSAILQSWALHLLQEETQQSDLMAYGLLIAAVQYDPTARGILRWKRVQEIGEQWQLLRTPKKQRQQ